MTLIRKSSLDAASDFEDGSLDFVYIDANHAFEYVVADIAAWTPKVRDGGVVSGHDYIHRYFPSVALHVIEAVHGYMVSYRLGPLYVCGRQRDTVRRDRPRSWWFRAGQKQDEA